MTYYNTKRILTIMKNYHIYASQQPIEKQYASVGVSVITDMPSGNTLSDVTANAALRGIDELPIHTQMRTDKKYLDDRVYRITDYADREVLTLRLEGMSIRDIGINIGKSKTYINNKLIKIAGLIGGR